MEGAIMLMLLTGFLAFIVYRMDQNELKSKNPGGDILENSSDYQCGFRDGMRWGSLDERPIDITPTSVIRKKRK